MSENGLTHQLSRRQILRATGAVAVATAATTLAVASPAQAAQSNWRWCSKCQGLWFRGSGTSYYCPATTGDIGTYHSSDASGNYTIKFTGDGGNGQDHWYWCYLCQGMFFNLYDNNLAYGVGTCPRYNRQGAKGHQFQTQYGSYRIEQVPNLDGGSRQTGWRWCEKCEGLWFSGNGTSGRCWTYGGHSGLGSGDYALHVAAG